MRINEVIVEAISLTKYEDTVEQSILDGITQSAAEISILKGYFPKEEKLANQGTMTALLKELERFLINSLSKNLADQLRIRMSREIGKDAGLTVKFEKTAASINAYVSGTDMIISNRYAEKLAKELLVNLQNTVLDNYGEDQLVDGVFFTLKLLGSKDKQSIQNVISDNVKSTVDSIVDDVLHELVHVVQHHRQYQRGRTDIEYRSYLDKTKDEFRSTASDGTDEKFYRLYYASPQEISAIAHQMSMEAVRAYDLRNIKSEEDIPEITSDDISSFIKTWIDDRFGDPRNQKEYAVFKRYAKLVYQEVQRYIDEKRKTFKPSEK